MTDPSFGSRDVSSAPLGSWIQGPYDAPEFSASMPRRNRTPSRISAFFGRSAVNCELAMKIPPVRLQTFFWRNARAPHSVEYGEARHYALILRLLHRRASCRDVCDPEVCHA